MFPSPEWSTQEAKTPVLKSIKREVLDLGEEATTPLAEKPASIKKVRHICQQVKVISATLWSGVESLGIEQQQLSSIKITQSWPASVHL